MNRLTKYAICCLVILSIQLPTTLIGQNTVTVINENFPTTADQLLQEHIDKKIFTGVVAGVSVDGQKIWMSAKGYSNKETKTAMETQTITRTASIAKSMTAVAIMQLVEQDLINLDLPIQTYISDYPKKKEEDISTRHLLHQTSGIPNYGSVKEVETRENYSTLSDAVDVFKNRDLRHTPGTAFYYSSYNYVVLGLIIEKVSGLTYEEYMTKNIWEKAGMTNTGVEKYGSTYPNKSSLYHRNKKGKIKLGKENNLSNRIPGGGFYSCVADMLRFGEAVINNELISAESMNILTTNSGAKKEGNPYAAGWFLYGGGTNPERVIGHSGEQTGASAQFMIIPSRKTVAIVMGNTSGSWGEAINLSIHLMNAALPPLETTGE